MGSIFEIKPGEITISPTTPVNLDLAVIHITFEGIQIFGGGVCTVIRGHLNAMSILQRHFPKYGIKLTPYFAEIGYADNHPRRDQEYERQAVAQIRALGGDMAYLANYSWGEQPFTAWGEHDLGPVDKWKAACASAATVALNFAKKHQSAVIYCHDCVFALTALYSALQAEAFGADIRAIYVVHSTALTHELPLPNPDRLMAECATIHWGKISPKVKIGYISQFIRSHLVQDYGARLEDTVSTGNGLNPTDPHFRLRTENEIISKLKQYQIPLDKQLLFSWGRPVSYKRFDLVLRVAAELRSELHAVVMVSPHSDELVELKKSLNLDLSLIPAFDAELVACVLQWKNTVVTPVLAHLEPCGLTPMEIRMHARRQGPLLVTSDTGGLPEQVTDEQDGFITRQDDVADIVTHIKAILAMKTSARQQIREQGLQKILRQYTWSSQILNTLATLSPGIRAIQENMKNDIVTEHKSIL
ncbi:glycosyltransferase family 4 protein [candidate division KSB1 bacterium]|nr:glycosyltransferase family 4 protein [candidate division KSB1 bacterium]